jgi:hypothetical protein
MLVAALRSTMFEDIRKFQELRPTTVTGHMYTMITPEKAAAMGVASAQHAAGAKVRYSCNSALPASRSPHVRCIYEASNK